MTWHRDRLELEIHDLRAAAAAYRSHLHRPARSEGGIATRAAHLRRCKWLIEKCAGAVRERKRAIERGRRKQNRLCICGHERRCHWKAMDDPEWVSMMKRIYPEDPEAVFCHHEQGIVVSSEGTTPPIWCKCAEFKAAAPRRKTRLRLLPGIGPTGTS